MASFLRPRRGRKSTADSSSIVLKKGEVFFEIDNGGISTGSNAKACGKIKLGNGSTVYINLGYFIDVNTTIIDFDDSGVATPEYNGQTYYGNLNAITPSATIKSILGNIKSLLFKMSTDITTIKNSSDIKPWVFVGSCKPNIYWEVMLDWRQYDEVMILSLENQLKDASAALKDDGVAYGGEIYELPTSSLDGIGYSMYQVYNQASTLLNVPVRFFVTKESGTIGVFCADNSIVLDGDGTKALAVFVR